MCLCMLAWLVSHIRCTSTVHPHSSFLWFSEASADGRAVYWSHRISNPCFFPLVIDSKYAAQRVLYLVARRYRVYSMLGYSVATHTPIVVQSSHQFG
uniref:Putative secreted protein n=1 Tax=Anopheles marajoara TaxID=58244 RepID=A0A2M4C9C7_9DIPT